MTERLDDVWTNRDYPVLREVTSRIDQGAGLVNVEELPEPTGLTPEQCGQALAALLRRGLLLDPLEAMGSAYPLGVCEVSGAAYLMTGLHPDGDDALSRLINGLRQAAEQTADEDERSRLRRAADALGGIARDIGVSVMATVITGGI